MGLTVSRKTAYKLTVNRQEKLFLTVNSQKCRLRLTVKKCRGISNLTISADLYRILASEELSKLDKPVPMF